MSELHKKLPRLHISFGPKGTNAFTPSTQAHTFGCKSCIDRAKLVALHATVQQLKEHYRRQLWHKEFPTPTSTSVAWLKVKHAFFFGMVWLAKAAGPVSSFFAQRFARMLNVVTENREAISLEIMNRRVPQINAALKKSDITQEEKNALLIEKASVINDHVKADLKIMAAACQGGHTRSMPQYSGSFGCPGVKKSVRKSVVPALISEDAHITSVSAVSDLNHSVATKEKGLYWQDASERTWVQKKHYKAQKEANNTTEYMPPAKIPLAENSTLINNTHTDQLGLYDTIVLYTDKHENDSVTSSTNTESLLMSSSRTELPNTSNTNSNNNSNQQDTTTPTLSAAESIKNLSSSTSSPFQPSKKFVFIPSTEYKKLHIE